METEINGVKTTEQPAPVAQANDSVDYEAMLAAKDLELAKVQIEKESYRKGMLKAKGKPVGDEPEEDLDERFRIIAREEALRAQESQIVAQKEELLRKALKENRELKLAQLNKGTPSAAIGSHSEGMPVRDTLITPEQMTYFKNKGWSDKDIERYKKNSSRNAK